jgi:hypothetical protein
MGAVQSCQAALTYEPDSPYQPDTGPAPNHYDHNDLQKLDEILKAMPEMMASFSETIRSLYVENAPPENKDTEEYIRLDTKKKCCVVVSC